MSPQDYQKMSEAGFTKFGVNDDLEVCRCGCDLWPMLSTFKVTGLRKYWKYGLFFSTSSFSVMPYNILSVSVLCARSWNKRIDWYLFVCLIVWLTHVCAALFLTCFSLTNVFMAIYQCIPVWWKSVMCGLFCSVNEKYFRKLKVSRSPCRVIIS